MKRDDDYIRQMLMDFEASDEIRLVATLTLNASPEGLKRHEHAELLCDAGLFQRVNPGLYRMTNQGHDYLAAIRNDTIWSKTKSGAKVIGGATLSMMMDIAIAYAKQEVSAKLGLKI